MLQVKISIDPDALLYDLHTKGLEVDDGAEFYTAIILGLFPEAREVYINHELQQDPPELGELIDEIDKLWDCLTTRPDWGSEEIEWCADHIRALRTMIYKKVIAIFAVPDNVSIYGQASNHISILSVQYIDPPLKEL